MKWYNYIIRYWAQIAVLIAAIGYVAKVLLDFYFKKKEIGINVFTKAKLDGLTRIFSAFEKVARAANNELQKADSPFLYPDDEKGDEFEMSLKQFSEALDEIRFLISTLEYARFAQINAMMLKVHFKLTALRLKEKMGDPTDKELIIEMKAHLIEIAVIHRDIVTDIQNKFS